MNIDFQRDLRQIFISVLCKYADRESKLAINKMTEGELVLRYLNWRRRMIMPQPRKLLESKEFATTKQNPSYCKQVNTLLSDIESGKDITCHLSESVLYAYVYKEK